MRPTYSAKQTGFSDDRRRSGHGSGSGGNYESYRPDRDRDRDAPRSAGDKSSYNRRESDSRDHHDDRDRSRDGERDRAVKTGDDRRSLALQLNTNIPTGPRNPTLSSARSSPLSTRTSALPPAPAYRGSVTTPGGLTAPSPQHQSHPAPKAKNPKVQVILEQIYKWEDIVRKRTLVSAQRDKKKREMDDRKRSLESLEGNRKDNTSMLEIQHKLKDHDMKEWYEIDKRFRSFDEPYGEYLEAIATAIHSATTQPETSNINPSAMADMEKKADEKLEKSVAALEKRMSDKFDAQLAALEKDMAERLSTKTVTLQKDLSTTRSELRALKTARTSADKKLTGLESSIGSALQAIDVVKEDNSASASKFLSQCAALEGQHTQLRSANSKVEDEINALNKFSQEATRRIGEVDSAIAAIGTTITTKAATSYLEGVKDEHSGEIDELKRLTKNHGDQLASLTVSLKSTTNSVANPSISLDSIKDQLRVLTDQVADHEQLRKDLEAVQLRTGKMERQFDGINIDEFLDEWSELGIKTKLPELDNDIEYLRHELNKLKGQGGRIVVQEPTPPVPDDGLRKDISYLQEGDRQKTEELKVLRERLANNNKKILGFVQQLLTQQMEPIVKSLDDLNTRFEQLPPVANQEQDLTGLMTTEQFDTRIAAIRQELPSTIADLVKRQATEPCVAQIQELRNEFNDIRGRVERLSMEVNNVNDQFQHLWTKPLWDQICARVDQSYSMFGPRIDANMRRLTHLEEKVMSLTNQVAPAPSLSGQDLP
ncbi:hypothetical protein PG999_001778 [Apiospora kogelbergensis]|uniref:Uncharacterized protein n=1 Tax=Apiospora kogelbergensis TaxID=1337665 RepID=A0AAW0R6G3_9PEZI